MSIWRLCFQTEISKATVWLIVNGIFPLEKDLASFSMEHCVRMECVRK